jgi:uncharacterized SAM-binding protein YcdF (DUF218 family)
MFILIGKMLKPLFTPLGFCSVLWFFSVLVYWRWSRVWGMRGAVAGIVVLLFFSNLMVGDALLGSLEDDYPILAPAACPQADAIVVLGGATYPPVPPRKSIEVGPAFDRLLHGMRLLRAQRAPLLVLTGGVISMLVGSDMTEARRMQSLALEYGVDPQVIVLEERSRNTYENAFYTRELLEKRGIKRIILVSSAMHMPRSVAVFKTQGFEVVPAPADVWVVPRPFHLARLLPNFNALEGSTIAIKEYLSTVVYRLKGWIK